MTPNTITFSCGASSLIFNDDGTMNLIGNAKDIALFLYEYAIKEENNIIASTVWTIRVRDVDIICIDFYKTYDIYYLGENKPDFFEDIRKEYKRICKMKAFW